MPKDLKYGKAKPENLRIDARSYLHLTKLARDNELWAPAVANVCFAIELALKMLAQLHNGRFAWTHDLSTLFEELPGEVQARIARKLPDYKAGSITEKDALDTIRRRAQAMRRGFEEFRYFSSHVDQDGKAYFSDPFPLLGAVALVMEEEGHAHELPGGRHIIWPITEEEGEGDE